MDDLSHQDAGVPNRFVTCLDSSVLLMQCLVSLGKPFSCNTFTGALSVLSAEVDLPYDVPGGMPSFRKTLALSFLFKFWTAVSVDLNIPLDTISTTASPEDISGTIHRQPSSGRRDNSVSFARLY